jgi:undecaprenyl-diphosphatase
LSQRKSLLFALLLLACFLSVAFLRGSFYNINLSVNLWFASVNTGFFTTTAKAISVAFDTTALLVISIIIASFLFIFHHRRYSLLLLGTMTGDTLLVEFFKTITASPRPLDGIIVGTGYSFPSGHTTSSVVLFGVLVYFAWKHWDSMKARVLTSGLYVSIVVVVGFDRIYLNVHWFSDVLGAVFLGAFWVAFSIWLFNRLIARARSREKG